MFNNTRMVQADPGIIVGPISSVLGFILDFIYNVLAHITGPAALGWSIIVFTILIRFAILPMAVKMQRNMKKMQQLKPQMDAINAKYKDKGKEEQQQKAMEIQALYRDNGVNPLAGCAPMLLQMPIFITLFAMFQRPYLYISQLHTVYANLAQEIMVIPGFGQVLWNNPSIGLDRIPSNMADLQLMYQPDLLRLFNAWTPADWQLFVSQLPAQYHASIQTLLYQKDAMEHFAGISLIANAGLNWPAVLLPIFAAATSFLTAKMTMKSQPTPTDTDAAGNMMASQQKVMLYMMPAMMGFFTFVSPGAVGLYWVVSNLFQIAQHWGLNKWFDAQDAKKSNIIDVK